MKYVVIIAIAALALVVILQFGSQKRQRPGTHGSAPIVAPYSNAPAAADHPDTFLTPSQATLDFENRAQQAIQSRYERLVNEDPRATQAGVVARVQVVITKNYDPSVPGTSTADYLGHVDIAFENPTLNRYETTVLQCRIDKVVPGPFSFKGDATKGYLWGCGQEGPLGPVTSWRESGHLD